MVPLQYLSFVLIFFIIAERNSFYQSQSVEGKNLSNIYISY